MLCALAVGVLSGQGMALDPSKMPAEKGREQLLQSTGRGNATGWRGKGTGTAVSPTKCTQWYATSIWYPPLFPPLS